MAESKLYVFRCRGCKTSLAVNGADAITANQQAGAEGWAIVSVTTKFGSSYELRCKKCRPAEIAA